MSYFRKLIKISLLFTSRILGFLTPRGPIVLMYHSVGGLSSKHSISPESFKKQLEYLTSRYNIVSLEDVVLWTQGKKEISKNSVALSFDDGYKDTKEVLLPLLVKYNIPATLFLTTMLEPLKTLGGMPRPTKDDVKVFSLSKLLSVEAHGHSHQNLKTLSEEEVEKDIGQNKENIVTMTGRVPIYFAYPYGYKNKEVILAVEKNFQAGFGIGEGSIRKGDSLFSLRRVQVDRTVTFLEFKLRLTSAVDVNRKIVDGLRKIWNKKK